MTKQHKLMTEHIAPSRCVEWVMRLRRCERVKRAMSDGFCCKTRRRKQKLKRRRRREQKCSVWMICSLAFMMQFRRNKFMSRNAQHSLFRVVHVIKSEQKCTTFHITADVKAPCACRKKFWRKNERVCLNRRRNRHPVSCFSVRTSDVGYNDAEYAISWNAGTERGKSTNSFGHVCHPPNCQQAKSPHAISCTDCEDAVAHDTDGKYFQQHLAFAEWILTFLVTEELWFFTSTEEETLEQRQCAQNEFHSTRASFCKWTLGTLPPWSASAEMFFLADLRGPSIWTSEATIHFQPEKC